MFVAFSIATTAALSTTNSTTLPPQWRPHKAAAMITEIISFGGEKVWEATAAGTNPVHSTPHIPMILKYPTTPLGLTLEAQCPIGAKYHSRHPQRYVTTEYRKAESHQVVWLAPKIFGCVKPTKKWSAWPNHFCCKLE